MHKCARRVEDRQGASRRRQFQPCGCSLSLSLSLSPSLSLPLSLSPSLSLSLSLSISSCASAKRNENEESQQAPLKRRSQFIEAAFHRKRKYEARQRDVPPRVDFYPSILLHLPFSRHRLVVSSSTFSLFPHFLFSFSFSSFFVYKPRHVIISRRYPLIKLLSSIFFSTCTVLRGLLVHAPMHISLPLCPLQTSLALVESRLDDTQTSAGRNLLAPLVVAGRRRVCAPGSSPRNASSERGRAPQPFAGGLLTPRATLEYRSTRGFGRRRKFSFPFFSLPLVSSFLSHSRVFLSVRSLCLHLLRLFGASYFIFFFSFLFLLLFSFRFLLPRRRSRSSGR